MHLPVAKKRDFYVTVDAFKVFFFFKALSQIFVFSDLHNYTWT